MNSVWQSQNKHSDGDQRNVHASQSKDPGKFLKSNRAFPFTGNICYIIHTCRFPWKHKVAILSFGLKNLIFQGPRDLAKDFAKTAIKAIWAFVSLLELWGVIQKAWIWLRSLTLSLQPTDHTLTSVNCAWIYEGRIERKVTSQSSTHNNC